jgi:serine phosphatase RsbU (regulator of sigma subunit)
LFGIGLVLLLEARREFVARVTPAVLLLAGSAFAMALHVWLQMTNTAAEAANLAGASVIGLQVAGVATLILASLLLAGYGIRLLLSDRGKFAYAAQFGLLVGWLAGLAAWSIFGTGVTLGAAAILAQYLIFVPASVIAAVGTLRIARLHVQARRVGWALHIAALLFIANAVFGATIGPQTAILALIQAAIAGGLTLALVRVLRRVQSISARKHEEQQILERDSMMASGIQKGLLPQQPLSTPAVRIVAKQRAARAVGGDWYDYEGDADGTAFQLGDASGKGLPAALLASVALSTLSVELHQKGPLPAIFDLANKQLLRRFEAGNFATLFMGRISPDGSDMEFINCGHEAPLVYRAAEDSWQTVDTHHDLPLAVIDGAVPRTELLHLAAGDRVLIYSDGLHDVRDENGKFLSYEAIVNWLNDRGSMRSELLLQELVEFAVEFGNGEVPDDITVMIVERRPASCEENCAERDEKAA